ncbi:MAG: hypothetical protein JSV80_04305 [Acidobacteriota bacterium]|nr:MAG: hypothetical protein JSV80_04305 [Acidobacteriota bacterium]
MRIRSVLAMLAISALAVAAPCIAQEMTGNGESIIVDMPPKETALPDGYSFVELQSRQLLVSADTDHPFHHAAIICSGTCTMKPGGESGSCSGGCTGRDPDGDVITFSWDGMDQGGWKLLGGSGKWSKASGSGMWKSMGPMGAGFTRSTWSGTIRMK